MEYSINVAEFDRRRKISTTKLKVGNGIRKLILKTLIENPGIKQSELAKCVKISTRQLSRHIKTLVVQQKLKVSYGGVIYCGSYRTIWYPEVTGVIDAISESQVSF
jgi:predicted transcriptional regulator